VTAIANSGYTFANWTENGSVVSPSASYTFALSANRTLAANFTANPVNYTISLNASPSAGGMVSGAGTFASGASRAVTATANSGYTFASWTENGSVVSTSASYTFALSANRTLAANFTANPVNYTISLNASKDASGTVSGGGTFASGSSHTVVASANSGYTFANWTENGARVSSSAGYTFTLKANRNLVANFRRHRR
jgi:anti-sigma factor RsiW